MQEKECFCLEVFGEGGYNLGRNIENTSTSDENIKDDPQGEDRVRMVRFILSKLISLMCVLRSECSSI